MREAKMGDEEDVDDGVLRPEGAPTRLRAAPIKFCPHPHRVYGEVRKKMRKSSSSMVQSPPKVSRLW